MNRKEKRTGCPDCCDPESVIQFFKEDICSPDEIYCGYVKISIASGRSLPESFERCFRHFLGELFQTSFVLKTSGIYLNIGYMRTYMFDVFVSEPDEKELFDASRILNTYGQFFFAPVYDTTLCIFSDTVRGCTEDILKKTKDGNGPAQFSMDLRKGNCFSIGENLKNSLGEGVNGSFQYNGGRDAIRYREKIYEGEWIDRELETELKMYLSNDLQPGYLYNKTKTGKYLESKVDKQFASHSAFCREYMKLSENGKTVQNDDEKRNLEKRFSRIFKGEKELKVYDLPLCTQILGLSCENILSAGKVSTDKMHPLSNYEASFSEEQTVWENCLKRADGMFFMYDEFEKNILEYAIECKNYKLIRYLMETGILKPGNKEYHDMFALQFENTLAQKEEKEEIYELFNPVIAQVDIRNRIIECAVRTGDTELLEKMHANDVPLLQSRIFHGTAHCMEWMNESLLETLSQASFEVLMYFTNPVEVYDENPEFHYFVYPYLGELISALIQNKSVFVHDVVKKCIRHNIRAKKKICKIMQSDISVYTEQYAVGKDEAEKLCNSNLQLYPEKDIVCYWGQWNTLDVNAVKAEEETENAETRRLLKKLNKTYDELFSVKI